MGEIKMKVCVYGLGHLGLVTSICLAKEGIQTIGLDIDSSLITQLKSFKLPIYEPGLEEFAKEAVGNGTLSFSDNLENSISSADIVWITFDTPVDDNDEPDIDNVIDKVKKIFPFLTEGTIVVSSSQLPVGTTYKIREEFFKVRKGSQIDFCYIPENLRLGSSVNAFMKSDFFVIGTASKKSYETLSHILTRFSQHVLHTSVPSAEMTKHALNAFLATSVGYINEIAKLCEPVGASASEVESALRCDPRIGKRAYVTPGLAFAGGTLARDLKYLNQMADSCEFDIPLLCNVLKSNNLHREWAFHRIVDFFGSDLRKAKIAIGGLAYKKNTSSIRRSLGIELCRKLEKAGAEIRVFDPQVRSLPWKHTQQITICETIQEALKGTDAFVITTDCPEFLSIEENVFKSLMREPTIFDPGRYLINKTKNLKYFTVGEPS